MNNKKWLHPPPEKFYSHPEQSRNDLDPFKVTELATPFAVLASNEEEKRKSRSSCTGFTFIVEKREKAERASERDIGPTACFTLSEIRDRGRREKAISGAL